MIIKQSADKNSEGLIKPYGGKLINLMASDKEAEKLKKDRGVRIVPASDSQGRRAALSAGFYVGHLGWLYGCGCSHVHDW